MRVVCLSFVGIVCLATGCARGQSSITQEKAAEIYQSVAGSLGIPVEQRDWGMVREKTLGADGRGTVLNVGDSSKLEVSIQKDSGRLRGVYRIVRTGERKEEKAAFSKEQVLTVAMDYVKKIAGGFPVNDMRLSDVRFVPTSRTSPALWAVAWKRYIGDVPCSEQLIVRLYNSDLTLRGYSDATTNTVIDVPRIRIAKGDARDIVEKAVNKQIRKAEASQKLVVKETRATVLGGAEIVDPTTGSLDIGFVPKGTKPRAVYRVLYEVFYVGHEGTPSFAEFWVDTETGEIIGGVR